MVVVSDPAIFAPAPFAPEYRNFTDCFSVRQLGRIGEWDKMAQRSGNLASESESQ
jgi:hypothetical protein